MLSSCSYYAVPFLLLSSFPSSEEVQGHPGQIRESGRGPFPTDYTRSLGVTCVHVLSFILSETDFVLPKSGRGTRSPES